MKREFIETKEFQSRWKALGMTEGDLQALQEYLLKNPTAGPVIQGTGGVRKLRWAKEGRGKSGGIRTIYFDMTSSGQLFLITVFGKNEQSDLSPNEKKAIKAVVKQLEGN